VPEQPDLPRAVAGDLRQVAAAREEVVARLDDAELVALRVGQHHVLLVGQLADIDVPATQFQYPIDGRLLVRQGLAGQVQVQSI
jgi:hypothetical protein